jgi:hypothetical protein
LAVMAGAAQPSMDRALNRSLENLRRIGQAAASYRADNQQYMPILLTYSRGRGPGGGVTLEGWCTWSAGGKNNNGFWASRPFDVEAADRPLNEYTQPGFVFEAPPIPQRMPASHPARTRDQAKVFQDPMDDSTRQRNWPNENKAISGYDDVGTSYHWTAEWWEQLSAFPNFNARFNEGARRLATGEGVDPARFVWMSDEELSVVTNSSNVNLQLQDNYGNVNMSQMLFIDGHVGYHATIPGRRRSTYSNDTYTFIFSDLQNPGGPE